MFNFEEKSRIFCRPCNSARMHNISHTDLTQPRVSRIDKNVRRIRVFSRKGGMKFIHIFIILFIKRNNFLYRINVTFDAAKDKGNSNGVHHSVGISSHSRFI